MKNPCPSTSTDSCGHGFAFFIAELLRYFLYNSPTIPAVVNKVQWYTISISDNFLSMQPKTTPKDFFLWAGAMVTLYASVFSLITLLFNYIDYTFPNVLNYYASNPYQSGMSYQIASLIILFPTFLIIMRIIRKGIQADATRAEVWVRRWALYLTLFVAGATIVIDLIVLLNTFLSGGDLTTAFILRVLVVLLVAGAGFLHFLADLRGYWNRFPERAQMVGWGVGALILASIVSGFFIIGTPWQAREYRLDEQRINDLQMLQSEITGYFQQKRVVPTSLSQLSDPLLYFTVPTDPKTGEPYEYTKTSNLGFELCATFNSTSRDSATMARTAPIMMGGKGVADSWQHEAGRVCFQRSIDPDFFPQQPVKY